jgi:hypothetical protein
MEDSIAMAAQSALGNSISLAGNAYPFGGQTQLGSAAQNAVWNSNSVLGSVPKDHDLVGYFKILKAEDGFIVRCGSHEGGLYKTFVANDINEAMDKAKVYLVTEALQK